MFRVRVPATTANLGPGFDTLGLALDLYNDYYFEELSSGVEILGVEKRYANRDNLVYQALEKACQLLDYRFQGIRIDFKSSIPIARGLGSSAACIVAGILAASRLAGKKLSEKELVRMATSIEGHCDNVAPALVGGLVVSLMEGSEVHYIKLHIPTEIKFLVLVPDYSLSTKRARQLLPDRVSFEDAKSNVSRVSMLISALMTARYDLLDLASDDRLHQPYRKELITGFDDIKEKSKELGAWASFISGAGPSIMIMLDKKTESFNHKMEDFLKTKDYNWQLIEMNIDKRGAILEEL